MPSWLKTRWWFTRLRLSGVTAVAVLAAACAAPPSATNAADPGFNVSQRISALLPTDILLLGEQHDAPDHQRLQRAVVLALVERGQLAALALEMAEQGTSTAGLPPDSGEGPVRSSLKWNDDGWPWANYGPVVMAAVRAGVPVLGANLPRDQDARRHATRHWDRHLGREQLQTQRSNIREGHCNLLPENQIAPMTRIQLARDAAMAKTVMAARQPGKTVLLIAGGGHVDRALGVPTHLPENTSSKVVLALANYAQAATNSGADAVWQTAALPPRDYCVDMKKQMGR
ncbi:MAG: ChaN family lipoprotein [Rhodoferax sp.]|nr:ChaN family lipoprotein [Rhodoferax sp.]